MKNGNTENYCTLHFIFCTPSFAIKEVKKKQKLKFKQFSGYNGNTKYIAENNLAVHPAYLMHKNHSGHTESRNVQSEGQLVAKSTWYE